MARQRVINLRGKKITVTYHDKPEKTRTIIHKGKKLQVSEAFYEKYQEAKNPTYIVDHKGTKIRMSEKFLEKYEQARKDEEVREQLKESGQDEIIIVNKDKSGSRGGVYEEFNGERYNVQQLEVAKLKNGRVVYEKYQDYRKRTLPDPIEQKKKTIFQDTLGLTSEEVAKIQEPSKLRKDILDPMNLRVSQKTGVSRQFAELGAGAVEGVLGISDLGAKMISSPEMQKATFSFVTTPEAWKYGAAALISGVVTEAKENPVRLGGSLVATAGVFKGASVVGGKVAGRVSSRVAPKYTLRTTYEGTASQTTKIKGFNVDATKTVTSYEIRQTGGLLQKMKIRQPKVVGELTGERTGVVYYTDTYGMGTGKFAFTGKVAGKGVKARGQDFSISALETSEGAVEGTTATVSRSAVKVGRKKGFSDTLSKTDFKSKRLDDVGEFELWATSEKSTSLGRSTVGKPELVKSEGASLSLFESGSKPGIDIKPLKLTSKTETKLAPTPKGGQSQESITKALNKVKSGESPAVRLKPISELTKPTLVTATATKQELSLSETQTQKQKQVTFQGSKLGESMRTDLLTGQSNAFDNLNIQQQTQTQLMGQLTATATRQRTATLQIEVAPSGSPPPIGGLLGGGSSPILPKPTFSLTGGRTNDKTGDKLIGRGTSYKPSLGGLVSGKTIKEAPKGKLTGLEVRYPVMKKMKRGLL